MKDFKLFDILPIGVIIFKNEKVVYINQHILDVLSIGYFSKKNSIELILKMLDVKNEKDLFLFFSSNDYFHTQNKIIQIEYNTHDDYHICTFTKINESLEIIPQEIDKHSQYKQIDTEVSKHFKLNNIQKIMVLTFYKGIPLKKMGKVIRINKDSIEVLVDFKHNISLQEQDNILLISNTKKGSSVLHGNVVECKNNIFVIKNFYLTKEDMHLRDGLRLKPDRNMIIKINSQEFRVYDISTRGISIFIDNKDEEKLLKKIKSLIVSLEDESLDLGVRYLKTIEQNGTILKIIFTISTIGNDYIKLNNYMIKKQNEILREIHNYK